jgi:hypothetical protein
MTVKQTPYILFLNGLYIVTCRPKNGPIIHFSYMLQFLVYNPTLRLKLPYNHQREKPEVVTDVTCSLYS